MQIQLSPSFVLTDEHPSARPGIPILLLSSGTAEPQAFGPADLVDFAQDPQPAAEVAARFTRLLTDDKEREFCERFLRSWPGNRGL